MNAEGRLWDNFATFLPESVPGDWCFPDGDHIFIHLPTGDFARLPIDANCREEWGDPCWQWDGNRENPTITPSILMRGMGEWHGYMTAGKLVSV